MGVSTDAILCYGISFEEGTVFPWQTEEDSEGDIVTWWRNLLGFRHSFEIFDNQGNYINGDEPSKDEIKAYYDEERAFDLEHPSLPVKVVMHCSHNSPMYILAVPSLVYEAERGHPEAIDLEKLFVTPDQEGRLVAFCNAHGIEVSQPRWWLASMWG